MKNIFICHTQAQLILASGLALSRFKNDENFLVLFIDFGIKEELKVRLKDTFDHILFLQSIYPAEYNTIKAKLKWYPQDWALIRQFLSEPVDRVFAVCDWLFLVQKTLQRAYMLNNNTVFAWLEDGIIAYYLDTNNRKGMDRYRITMAFRRLLFRDLLGVGKFYDRDFEGVGGLKVFQSYYVCYPSAVREPYRSCKPLVEITANEYHLGLQAMYAKKNLNIAPNSVILVLDRLDRYAFPEKVQSSLASFIKNCQNKGKTVVCKFHPAETMFWGIFDECPVLDKSVGIESAYVSLENIKETITIAGIKSTGLISAKKLGYNVISLFPSCGETNEELESFYKRMGIDLVTI